MAANSKRLVELSMVPPLAVEVARQINGAPKSAKRLTELSMTAPLAKEVVRQMVAGVGNAARLEEAGMNPDLAAALAAQFTASLSIPVTGLPNQPLVISGAAPGDTLALSSPPTGVRINSTLQLLYIDTAGSYPTITITKNGTPYVVSTTISAPSYVALGNIASVNLVGDSIASGSNATSTPNRWANIYASAQSATLANGGIGGTVLSNAQTAGNVSQVNNWIDRIAGFGAFNGTTRFTHAYGLFNDGRYTAAPATFNVAEVKRQTIQSIDAILIKGLSPTLFHLIGAYWISNAGLATGGDFGGQTRDAFEAFVQAAFEAAYETGVMWTNTYAYSRDNGYPASGISGDNIHPNDTGHSIIATAATSRAYFPNTLGRPASVTSTPTGLNVAWTCSTVAGAIGYEYAIVDLGLLVTTSASSTNSGNVTVSRGGLYNGKARAVFADGSRGPWLLNPTKFTVQSAPGIFVQANMSGVPQGTSLARVTPQIGGPFQGLLGVDTFPPIDGNGGIYLANSTGNFRNSAVPNNANYYVKGRFRFYTKIAGQETCLVARQPDDSTVAFYWVRYDSTNEIFQLLFGGTQIGSNFAYAFPSSGTAIDVIINANASSISATINGTVNAISGTNSSQPNAGQAGIRLTGPASGLTTGVHIEMFEAGSL